MKRLGMLQRVTIVAASALVTMAFTACGDDDDGVESPDARVFDAPISIGQDAHLPDARTSVFDARPPDAAQPDAAPTFSGTLALHDIRIVGVPTAGHGLQATIDFTQNGKPVLAQYTVPTSFPSCSATVTDVTVPAQQNPTVNEGTVTFSRNGSAIAAPCTFANGAYRCVFGGGASGTIAQSATNTMLGTFTNSTFTFTNDHIGAYLIDTTNGAAWPIAGVAGMTAGLQNVGAAFPSSVGQFIVAYGIGPIAFTDTPAGTASPGAPPELMADTDTFTVQLTPGGGNHFQAYTSATIDAGNDFELDAATQTAIGNALDLYSDTDTVLGCSDAQCPAGSALVTVVSIITTDTAGGPATDLLDPTRYSGSVTCPNLGGNKVTITKELKQILRMANPRKMQISIFRDGGDVGALSRNLSVVAGHGWVAFKDVSPP